MRYGYNSVVKVNQELLKPCDSIEIQVVGRLIEQQDIRITKQRFGKKYLNLKWAWKLAHELIVLAYVYAKS